MSEAKLVLAVPSKGRLQENANAFFARAGLAVTQGRRQQREKPLSGFPADMAGAPRKRASRGPLADSILHGTLAAPEFFPELSPRLEVDC